jgi:hypothetical protein
MDLVLVIFTKEITIFLPSEIPEGFRGYYEKEREQKDYTDKSILHDS